MASPDSAPISVVLDPIKGSGAVATQTLLAAMLRANKAVSDMIFSPGRPPQVQLNGELVPVQAPGMYALTADDTRRIASDLIGNNNQAISMLREQGSCDISYSLPGLARFRVNVFIQRGSCAIVMRAIPTSIPTFDDLGLPAELKQVASLEDGIVLVTGQRGSGKSSTLATLLNDINEKRVCHIITIEDPLEFLHNHKRSTVHQRELHSDTANFSLALRAALRQAPRVILIGDVPDRETMETVIEAAETGHLVLCSLNSADVTKAVERILNAYPPSELNSVRSRLARTVRYVIAQRLLPRRDGNGRVAAIVLLKGTVRTSNCLESNDYSSQNLLQLLQQSGADGMQHFDSEIEKLVRQGTVELETGLRFASNPQSLREILAR